MISAERDFAGTAFVRRFRCQRFRLLRDGRISYRVKKSSRRTSRCRVMTPGGVYREALCSRAAAALSFDAVPWRARAKLRPRIVPKLPGSAKRACASSSRSPDRREPRGKAGERPPPRDKSGPIIPAAVPVSATSLARSIDGADVPFPNRSGRSPACWTESTEVDGAKRSQCPLDQAPRSHRRRPALRSQLERAVGNAARANLRGRRQGLRPLRRQARRARRASRNRPRAEGDLRPSGDLCPEFHARAAITTPVTAASRLPALGHSGPVATTSYALTDLEIPCPPRTNARSSQRHSATQLTM